MAIHSDEFFYLWWCKNIALWFPEYQEKEKEKENNKKKGQDYSETKLEEKIEKKNMIGCTRWNLTSFIGLEAYLYKMPQSYKKKNKAR